MMYLTEPERRTPVIETDVFVARAAAALCARVDCGSRELPYGRLREEMLAQNVILEV